MARIAVQTSVSEEVYERVVVPEKNKRTFNQLVAKLLEVYYKDERVRSLVDSDGEDIHPFSTIYDGAKENIKNAKTSLAKVDVLTETIKETLEEGSDEISEISSKGSDQENELPKMIETDTDFDFKIEKSDSVTTTNAIDGNDILNSFLNGNVF